MSEEIEHVRDIPAPMPWPARLWHRLEEVPEFSRWFEGLRPWSGEEWRLQIEEELTDDTMVIRAELPGIDPDKDVEITVADGVLNLGAERRYEKTEEEKGRTRSEFRYGSFTRAVGVPRAQRRRRQGELQGRHPRGAVPVQGAPPRPRRARSRSPGRKPAADASAPVPTRQREGLAPRSAAWPPDRRSAGRESVRATPRRCSSARAQQLAQRAPGLSPLPYALVTVAR